MNTNYNNYNFPGGSTQAPLVVQLVKNPPAMQETWVGKIPCRRKWQPIPVFLPGISHGERSLVAYSSWVQKKSGMTERLNNNSNNYFLWTLKCLFPGGSETVKRLSTIRETQVRSLGWEDPLEKEMAIHSRTIAWKIPWTEEPGSLQSLWLQRVGHDWAISLHFTSLPPNSYKVKYLKFYTSFKFNDYLV